MRGVHPGGILPAHLADQIPNLTRTTGRPGWPCRAFHVQNRRKRLRCQATTVSGFTMTKVERQSNIWLTPTMTM
jgi:hypothetical protein